MSKKARIWIGSTILAVMIFNYAVIGLPLYRKISLLENRIRLIMIKQVKMGNILSDSEDNYVLDLLKKETITIDRKLVVLNCAAVSAIIITMSWMIFGLAVSRPDRRKL